MSSNLETRSLLDELRSFEKGAFLDLGHPLLNRIAESFVKAAGIGAVQAVARDACFTIMEDSQNFPEGAASNEIKDIPSRKKSRLPGLRGETSQKSVEALVMNSGKEAMQWGLAAGMYSGLTYGLREARGTHDWKNSAVAGGITGAALALTADNPSQQQIVQGAITGAAFSTAANLLSGIF